MLEDRAVANPHILVTARSAAHMLEDRTYKCERPHGKRPQILLLSELSDRSFMRAWAQRMFTEHSAWAKTSHDQNQNYTHSSLRGGKEFTTRTGRLRFPATVEVRVNFEE